MASNSKRKRNFWNIETKLEILNHLAKKESGASLAQFYIMLESQQFLTLKKGPSNADAFSGLKTAREWNEQQSECCPTQLLQLKRIRDLAAIKMKM
ncbi:hypothetical protein TNCV_4021421 [Trichonephila clavipes]|nr:hypothetical protein TNCV_4021421 [Trichonephila clavipes]